MAEDNLVSSSKVLYNGTMDCIDIAGLKVNNITKRIFLETVTERLRTGQKTFVITPYSEFLYRALRSQHILELLNTADISIPDGVGILLAAKFLSLPAAEGGYYKKFLQTMWQLFYSSAAVLLNPAWIKTVIPEKIAGADVTWDLCKLAAQEQKSVYLLGGFGDTPKLAARKLTDQYPNLNIVGYSNKHPHDPSIMTDIAATKPDMIFVAFGPIRQEEWIAQHLHNLPATLAIGVGGTFDYIAGKRALPPAFIRRIGLEWLWRLVTQPYRVKRIWQATAGLSWLLIKYKFFSTLPYRQNAMSFILNKDNQVFIARFNPDNKFIKKFGQSPRGTDDFWQLPQGGIEEGERPVDGARREVFEETGMKSLELLKISDHVYRYSWSTARKLPLHSKFKHRGQEQKIFFFRFTGEESEIKLDQEEFVEYKWVPIDKLLTSIHPQKRPVTELALSDMPGL